MYPDKGTVSFSAGLHGWAFTLTTFAKMYASKFGTDEAKMMEKLWGENFFDPATKKWTKKPTDSKTCKRGFVQFCYEPIKQVINLAMNDNKVGPGTVWVATPVYGELNFFAEVVSLLKLMSSWCSCKMMLLKLL